jgi:ArsR family transcriptional regulator
MHNITNVHLGYTMMRDLVKVMQALSDETRLRTLNLLLERECCVCEVMQALNVSQSRASRSLSALYDAGFLKRRKEGIWAFYSIDRHAMQECYSELIDALQKELEGNKGLKVERERLRQIQPVNSCRTTPAN